jgi:GTP-binding protein Era
VAVVGKPNAGKSTLVNALVGKKVSIVSSKPQTTRHRVLGVKNGNGSQMVFVDTPGIHEPSHQLGKFMEKTYKSEIDEADVVLLILDATHNLTGEDFRARDMLFQKGAPSKPVFVLINKIDIVEEEKLEEFRRQVAELGEPTRILEISALKKKGLRKLNHVINHALPPGPPYFPQDMPTDQTPQLQASEAVREKVLLKTRQEVPHGVFVHTQEMRDGESPGVKYFGIVIYVERKSHKGIIIGKGGAMLKKIGTLARKELELLTGSKVFLDLWVKVKEDWKDRKDLLKSWGYSL